jgi:hypothetical protein
LTESEDWKERPEELEEEEEAMAEEEGFFLASGEEWGCKWLGWI